MPDVTIVGAGVIGASIAYHLASMGGIDVRVVEREPSPGLGSTGRATGGFRAQFGTAIDVRLSLLSRDKLIRFGDEVGIDSGYRPYGYLFLARSEATLGKLTAARAVQHEAGLTEAVEVSPADVAALNPWIEGEGVLGGSYCPTDGYIRPTELLRGYIDAARRLGCRFDFDTACLGFEMAGGRIAAVRTSRGRIPTGNVVNAAGAWAAAIARFAGVDLPVRPLRRSVALTGPVAAISERMPMTICADDGFHFRVRDGRLLLLLPDTPGEESFDLSVPEPWFRNVVARARQEIRIPRDVPIRYTDAWSGLYEMSPDGHALLGAAPGVENLFLANGSSGHGVMHAPALGQLLAEIILRGEATSLDVRALRPDRFAENRPIPGADLL